MLETTLVTSASALKALQWPAFHGCEAQKGADCTTNFPDKCLQWTAPGLGSEDVARPGQQGAQLRKKEVSCPGHSQVLRKGSARERPQPQLALCPVQWTVDV